MQPQPSVSQAYSLIDLLLTNGSTIFFKSVQWGKETVATQLTKEWQQRFTQMGTFKQNGHKIPP